MITGLKNFFCNRNRYREHSEAAIVSCFFNPQASPYRSKAFQKFYSTIKHMNHLILEGVIGNAKPELAANKNILHIPTENLLWHKESLLNLAISKLPKKVKYVFWVDADVLFTNKNWLTDSVKEFKQGARILQPFEHCVHLEQDQTAPNFDLNHAIEDLFFHRHPRLWRSFSANFVDNEQAAKSKDYNTHGHVGFAWGATREVLESVPLYDRALIGGADHIIAHAAAGQIPNACIDKSFTDDLDAVYEWSRKFYKVVDGKIAYTKGNLFHLWHGDIEKREYLKRIQDFTPETKQIVEKDANGLYVTKKGDSPYIKDYFDKREVKTAKPPKNTGCSGSCTHTTHNHYNDYGAHHNWSTSSTLGHSNSNTAQSAGYDNGVSNASETFS